MTHNLWKIRHKPVFITGIIFIILFVSISEAIEVAQIEPAKIRLSILPGNSKTGAIKINNFSQEPKNIKAYLEDWVYLPVCDGTKDFKPAGTLDLSASKWISFLPSEFTVPAYGTKLVNYTVKVPQDAKGGHYAVLFFENYLPEPQKSSEGVSVNVAVRVASLFYIEPKGAINRNTKIEELKLTREENKFQLTAKFSNIGNVDINTKATFFIIDKKGMVYARGEFNEVYTFPQDVATLVSTFKEPLPEGKYDLVLTIDIGRALEQAGLGKVPAISKEAEIEIGENGKVLKIGELK